MADDGRLAMSWPVLEPVDGGAWGVYQVLGTDMLPTLQHWQDDEWVARLFGLSQRGVQLDGFLAWAFHVAAEGRLMLDCMDMVKHVESLLEHHRRSLVQPELQARKVVVSRGALGVAEILGSDLPTKAEWNDFTWVRTLFELHSRGVEIADFQAWSRDAAKRENPIMFPDLTFSVADSAVSLKRGIMECSHNPASPESQEVDGPPPPTKLEIDVLVEVAGEVRRKRKREEEMAVNVTAVFRTNDDSEEVTSHSRSPAKAEATRK